MPRSLRQKKQPAASTLAADSTAKKTTKTSREPAPPKTTSTLARARSSRARPDAETSSATAAREVSPKKSRSIKGANVTTKARAVSSTNTKTAKARAVSSVKIETAEYTRRVAIVTRKSPSLVAEGENRSPTPSTIIPSTPPPFHPTEGEASPGQSSNAENHSPLPMPSMKSSPPLAESTPKGNGRRAYIDFSSDAGYTPASKRKLTSAERPRLQDLDARTLEPIGTGDDEDLPELPSPTPRRRGRPFDFLIAEEEGIPVRLQSTAPLREGGRPFFMKGDEEAFTIFSDPKSPSQETPRNDRRVDLDSEVMRPPTSSLSPPRKRSSSEIVVSDGELTSYERTIRPKRPRQASKTHASKGAKSKATKKTPTTTNSLRDLLPRRRKMTRSKDMYNISSSESEPEDSEADELSRPSRPSRRSKTTVKRKRQVKKGMTGASTSAGKATAASSDPWSRPLTNKKRTPTRTYSRKPVGDTADDTTAITHDGLGEGSSELTPVPSSDLASSIEMADGVLRGAGVKKLEEMKAKFAQVDEWDLMFEEVSDATLERTSDPDKR